MKKLLLLLLFISQSMFGQETNNFKIENRDLIWQYIFETDLSQEELKQELSTKGLWESFEKVGDDLIGICSGIDADFKGAGYGEMSVPMYVARMSINFHSLIQFKDGRYRVTITNIKLVQKYDDPLVKQGQVISLNDFAVKRNGDFKTMFLRKPSEIYNYTFMSSLEIQQNERPDDW